MIVDSVTACLIHSALREPPKGSEDTMRIVSDNAKNANAALRGARWWHWVCSWDREAGLEFGLLVKRDGAASSVAASSC